MADSLFLIKPTSLGLDVEFLYQMYRLSFTEVTKFVFHI